MNKYLIALRAALIIGTVTALNIACTLLAPQYPIPTAIASGFIAAFAIVVNVARSEEQGMYGSTPGVSVTATAELPAQAVPLPVYYPPQSQPPYGNLT